MKAFPAIILVSHRNDPQCLKSHQMFHISSEEHDREINEEKQGQRTLKSMASEYIGRNNRPGANSSFCFSTAAPCGTKYENSVHSLYTLAVLETFYFFGTLLFI